jgi:Zn-dependent protease with chaperone function
MARPNKGKIEFDKEFFERLSPEKFKPFIVHEFYHIKESWRDIPLREALKNFILPLFFSGLFFGYVVKAPLFFILSIPFLILLMIILHRSEEYKADDFVVERYPKYRNNLISALEITMELKSARDVNLLGFLSHPKTEDRIKRLKDKQ